MIPAECGTLSKGTSLFFYIYIGILSEVGVTIMGSEKKLNGMCISISSSCDIDFIKIKELTWMVF